MASKPTSKSTYSNFIKISPQERLVHSEYFIKNKPGFIPIVLYSRNALLPQLPNCKFLIDRNSQLYAQLNRLKNYIKQSRGKQLSESESIFFGYNRKLMNGNVKAGQFYNKEFKDLQKDGWMHIQYGKQDIY